MDNAHSTARGLAELAVNQMTVTQGLLARLLNALEEAQAITVACESQVDAVFSLVHAGVGTGENAMRSGEEMAENTALAVSTIGDQSDGILPAVNLARGRVTTALTQITNAKSSGETYIAQLSS